ncbi:MAG TPA: GYD domain-containing protein [Jatrophihabitans sp.]|jgi:uncharacterized protein with GYD domain
MAKYLAIITYTAEGLKGLMAKGGTARVEASRELVASAGGSLESFYFALGTDDAYIVCDLPDNVAAAATAMSAAASGMVVNRMVALLTAEEVDRAAAVTLTYQAPGS